jgi:membrane associated rhomboid family serine protease
VTAPIQTCYRHHDRRAGVVCQRCDRPICPDCMHQASVGFHCPECTKQGAQKVIRGPQALITRPVVTQALIAINAVIFLLGIGPGLKTKDSVIVDFGLIADVFGPRGLIGVANGEWYRMVTSGFLHFTVIHIVLNMWVLYSLGRILEPALGRFRLALVYLVCMLGGALGVMILDPNAFTAGASGAVFGLMGVLVALFRSRNIDIWSSGLGATLLLNLAFTFTISGISIGGHIGGLLTGLLAGWVIHDAGPRYIRDETITTVAVGALGVILAGATIMVAGMAS